MNDATKTRAAVTVGVAGTRRWRLIVDEPMADAVERIRNHHVAEPIREILNAVSPLVKGSLKVELGLPDRIDGATKGE